MSCGTLVPALVSILRLRAFYPLWRSFPALFCSYLRDKRWPTTPRSKLLGLGSFPFARRYSGNRCFFLLLRVLRCFSSPGSLVYTMNSCIRTWATPRWVSPFGYQGIYARLRLPLAFRSLPRPSSALGALASTLCSCSLDYLILRPILIFSFPIKLQLA